MIYLDTHVVVWLYAGLVDRLSETAKALINDRNLCISSIVRLELQYLYEIDRITVTSDVIIADLSTRIGLEVCQLDFDAIISQSLFLTWTRDPFDRIITANAMVGNNILLTKDTKISQHYQYAQW